MREFRDHLVDGAQSARIAVSQRTQNNAIHQAEDGSIRADAERQRSNGDRAKSEILAQRARREPEIGHQSVEHICMYDDCRGKFAIFGGIRGGAANSATVIIEECGFQQFCF